MELTLRAADTIVRIAGDRLAAGGGTPDVVLPDSWRLTPGLIDLQVNGMAGAFPLVDPPSIEPLDALLARAGVTSWLVAAPSSEASAVEGLARAAEPYAEDPRTGLLGLHLEGPVLSPALPGAHPPEHLRDGDDPEARALLDLPSVRFVTLAPEVPGALDYAQAAQQRSIVVAAGHTAATFEQATEAIDAGVRVATHLFNAMTPVHHRAPGAAIAYLLDPRARVAFIADGVHLHPATEDVILAAAGERAFLVSDAAPDAGVAPGRTPPDGVLAGSAVTLADAVALLAARHGFPSAIGLATTGSAAVLGLEDRGTLRPGARADVAIWDEHLCIAGTIRAGEVVFASEALSRLID